MSVQITSTAFSVERLVDTSHGDGLDAYLRHLAANWRGWDGRLDWRSLEGDFFLSASIDQLGHVTVWATLQDQSYKPPPAAFTAWSASVAVFLDAGALDGLARTAKLLLST